MTPTLHIPIGVPGCGKSTWAQTVPIPVHPPAIVERVSSDEIRKIIFGSLVVANDDKTKAQANVIVFENFHRDIRLALDRGDDVIADATNLTSASRRTLRDIAADTGAAVHYVLFDNVAEAVEQNRQRVEDAIVPDHVMDSMVMKLSVAREMIDGEGWDKLTRIHSVNV